MANECATTNCEDKSGKDDFAYCGQGNCSSCGGGCGDDNCSKCNRRPKWGSKKASTDRASSNGWGVFKRAKKDKIGPCNDCGKQMIRTDDTWVRCPDDNCMYQDVQPAPDRDLKSNDRAFSTGWSIIKQRLTLCDECSTAVYDAMSSHMDPFADEQPDFEEIAATMGADLPDHRCESREEAEEWQRMELKCLCACNGR